MTLTRRDIALAVADRTGLQQQECHRIVDLVIQILSDNLAQGNKVELRKFGVLEVRVRQARIGRNPKRPEVDVPIPRRAVVRFKAGKELKAALAGMVPPKPKRRKTVKRAAKPAPAKPPGGAVQQSATQVPSDSGAPAT